MEDFANTVGLESDFVTPTEPRLTALRAKGWEDFEGSVYTAFCERCGNAGGLMVRERIIVCRGCLMFGHPSFDE